METIVKVDGMTCKHCKKSVEEGLQKIEGVTEAIVNLEEKAVTVNHNDTVTLEILTETIEDLGYDIM